MKPSTVSTDFTFIGWDLGLNDIFTSRTLVAQYKESPRNYTLKYVARGLTLKEETAPYGSTVVYSGDIPTYTEEESAYVFYLFTGWDKSGYVNGDKTINAVYDRFEYTNGAFNNMDISEMRPVQIYAMIKMSQESNIVELKDSITFNMGNDFSYNDIEDQTIIAEKTVFTGTNYLDTGIKLLETDESWTLAIDYKFGQGNTNNSVLAQCYQSDGSNGFKLWNSNRTRMTWGTTATDAAGANSRDIIVLRHIKGESKVHVYKGNMSDTSVGYIKLSSNRSPVAPNSTLVFGCSKADDGAFENYASGTIYWCKLWKTDLGDDACRSLAAWTHETINLEVSGFKSYYLSNGSGQRCALRFLASHLLSRQMALSGSSSNTGGWAEASLNTFLNTRFYDAIPIQWKQLVKQVKVSSSAGDKSSEITTSNCYIAIPSLIEIDPSRDYDPYSFEGSAITYIANGTNRRRGFLDDGVLEAYWTRSPVATSTSYYMSVAATGEVEEWSYALYEKGIVIELCF